MENLCFTDNCPQCQLEKRFMILFHLILAIDAKNMADQLGEFSRRGLNDEELTSYEVQTLEMLDDPEAHGAIKIEEG